MFLSAFRRFYCASWVSRTQESSMWRVFAALTSFLCQGSCYIISQIDLSCNGRSYCRCTSEQNILVMDLNRISPTANSLQYSTVICFRLRKQSVDHSFRAKEQSISTIEKRGAVLCTYSHQLLLLLKLCTSTALSAVILHLRSTCCLAV